jgi:hypothetical protein
VVVFLALELVLRSNVLRDGLEVLRYVVEGLSEEQRLAVSPPEDRNAVKINGMKSQSVGEGECTC